MATQSLRFQSDLINSLRRIACMAFLVSGLSLPFSVFSDEEDMLEKVEASAEKINDLIEKYKAAEVNIVKREIVTIKDTSGNPRDCDVAIFYGNGQQARFTTEDGKFEGNFDHKHNKKVPNKALSLRLSGCECRAIKTKHLSTWLGVNTELEKIKEVLKEEIESAGQDKAKEYAEKIINKLAEKLGSGFAAGASRFLSGFKTGADIGAPIGDFITNGINEILDRAVQQNIELASLVDNSPYRPSVGHAELRGTVGNLTGANPQLQNKWDITVRCGNRTISPSQAAWSDVSQLVQREYRESPEGRQQAADEAAARAESARQQRAEAEATRAQAEANRRAEAEWEAEQRKREAERKRREEERKRAEAERKRKLKAKAAEIARTCTICDPIRNHIKVVQGQIESTEKEIPDLEQAVTDAEKKAARTKKKVQQASQKLSNFRNPSSSATDVESGRTVTSSDLEVRQQAAIEAMDRYRNEQQSAQETSEQWENLDDPNVINDLKKKADKRLEAELDAARKANEEAEAALTAAKRKLNAAKRKLKELERQLKELKAKLEECLKKCKENSMKIARGWISDVEDLMDYRIAYPDQRSVEEEKIKKDPEQKTVLDTPKPVKVNCSGESCPKPVKGECKGTFCPSEFNLLCEGSICPEEFDLTCLSFSNCANSFTLNCNAETEDCAKVTVQCNDTNCEQSKSGSIIQQLQDKDKSAKTTTQSILDELEPETLTSVIGEPKPLDVFCFGESCPQELSGSCLGENCPEQVQLDCPGSACTETFALNCHGSCPDAGRNWYQFSIDTNDTIKLLGANCLDSGCTLSPYNSVLDLTLQPALTPIFSDGFESGDLSAWSTTSSGDPFTPHNYVSTPQTGTDDSFMRGLQEEFDRETNADDPSQIPVSTDGLNTVFGLPEQDDPASRLKALLEAEKAAQENALNANNSADNVADVFTTMGSNNIQTASSLAVATYAAGVQKFLIDFASALADLASVSDFFEGLLKGDMKDSSLIENLDSIYEAAKDGESLANNLADGIENHMQPRPEGSPEVNTSPVNDFFGTKGVADDYWQTDGLTDINSLKSDFSDIVSLIDDHRGGKPINPRTLGQLIIRIGKGFAENDLKEREEHINNLQNELAAGQSAQSGIAGMMQGANDTKWSTIDELKAIRAAIAALIQEHPEALISTGGENQPTVNIVTTNCRTCQPIADAINQKSVTIAALEQRIAAIEAKERALEAKKNRLGQLQRQLQGATSVLQTARAGLRRTDVPVLGPSQEIQNDINLLEMDRRTLINEIGRLEREIEIEEGKPKEETDALRETISELREERRKLRPQLSECEANCSEEEKVDDSLAAFAGLMVGDTSVSQGTVVSGQTGVSLPPTSSDPRKEELFVVGADITTVDITTDCQPCVEIANMINTRRKEYEDLMAIRVGLVETYRDAVNKEVVTTAHIQALRQGGGSGANRDMQGVGTSYFNFDKIEEMSLGEREAKVSELEQELIKIGRDQARLTRQLAESKSAIDAVISQIDGLYRELTNCEKQCKGTESGGGGVSITTGGGGGSLSPATGSGIDPNLQPVSTNCTRCKQYADAVNREIANLQQLYGFIKDASEGIEARRTQLSQYRASIAGLKQALSEHEARGQDYTLDNGDILTGSASQFRFSDNDSNAFANRDQSVSDTISELEQTAAKIEAKIAELENYIESNQVNITRLKRAIDNLKRGLADCEKTCISVVIIDVKNIIGNDGYEPRDPLAPEANLIGLGGSGSGGNVSIGGGGGTGGGGTGGGGSGPSPIMVSLSSSSVLDRHVVGSSPCSDPMGSVTVQLASGNNFTVSNIQVTGGINGFVDADSPSMSTPLGSHSIDIEFNCASAATTVRTGTVTATITDSVTGQTADISINVTNEVTNLLSVLPSGGTFIPVNKLFLAGPEPLGPGVGCANNHYHGGPAVACDGSNVNDPAPSQCGFGIDTDVIQIHELDCDNP